MQTFKQRLARYKKARRFIKQEQHKYGGEYAFGLCFALGNGDAHSTYYPINVGHLKEIYPEIIPFIPRINWFGNEITDESHGYWWATQVSCWANHRLNILNKIIDDMTTALKENPTLKSTTAE